MKISSGMRENSRFGLTIKDRANNTARAQIPTDEF